MQHCFNKPTINSSAIKSNKSKGYLIAISIAFCFLILARAYFFRDGFMSPDSSQYLLMASNLIKFGSLYDPTFPNNPFPIWQPLYPILIAFFSMLTGLKVFWSSKFINIFIFIALMVFLHKEYKENAYVLSLLFFFASFNRIFSHTWSEVPFIFGLVFFSWALHRSLRKVNFWNCACLFFGVVILFYSRYIGFFALGPFFLVILYHLFIKKTRLPQLAVLLLSFALAVSLCIFQLSYNAELTGHVSGSNRILSYNTALQNTQMLLQAIYYELNIMISQGGKVSIGFFGLQIIVLVFFLVKRGKYLVKPTEKISLEKVLVLLGLIYIGCLVILRFVFLFDDIDYRLLGPGSFLIFLGLMGWLAKSGLLDHNPWVNGCLTIFILISLSSEVIHYVYRTQETNMSYVENMHKQQTLFLEMTHGSIVIFPDRSLFHRYHHIRYLRPDLKVVFPEIGDTQESFFDKLDCTKELYLFNLNSETSDIEDYFEAGHYNPAIYSELEPYISNKISVLTCP